MRYSAVTCRKFFTPRGVLLNTILLISYHSFIVKGLFGCNGSVPLAHTNNYFLPFQKGVNRTAVWKPFHFEMAAGGIFAEFFLLSNKWLTIGDNHFYKSNYSLLMYTFYILYLVMGTSMTHFAYMGDIFAQYGLWIFTLGL